MALDSSADLLDYSTLRNKNGSNKLLHLTQSGLLMESAVECETNIFKTFEDIDEIIFL